MPRYSSDDDEYAPTHNERKGGRRSGSTAPCPSKNAVMARENRARKKQYVRALEARVRGLRAENARLGAVARERASAARELRAEVRYLRAALANSKEIGALVRRIRDPANSESPTSVLDDIQRIGPTSLFEGDDNDLLFPMMDVAPVLSPPPPPPPPAQLDSDEHSYSAKLRLSDDDDDEEEKRPPLKHVGVCLHVSRNNLSLEFCAACNESAIKNWDFGVC